MSEEQLHKQSRQPVSKEESAGNLRVSVRRRLLKGTVAIPVIMTLHSGAVLARTSNLVGPTQVTESAVKDENGNLRCIHPTNPAEARNDRVDLGEDPSFTTDTSPDLEAQATACQEGGGILVSATAWNSIGPRIQSI